MRLRFGTQFNRCCLDTFRANLGTHEPGDQLTCRHCDSRFTFQEDGYWTRTYNTVEEMGDQ